MLQGILRTILLSLILFMMIPIQHVTPDLKPYHDPIIKYVEEHCSQHHYFHPLKTFIRFNKLPSPIIGLCRVAPLEYIIDIDPQYWNNTSEDLRWELMLHEMSHCIFRLDHTDDPDNYMYPELVDMKKEKAWQQFENNVSYLCEGDK